MEVSMLQLAPGDPGLIDKIVCHLKSNGIFDQFRKECIADVDTKPAYQNLRQRVEGSVSSFLSSQEWRPDLNKNQLRDSLRKHIHESGFLEIGVERIVDQVVNPKMYTVFFPKVEDVVYGFLGVEKPKRGTDARNGVHQSALKTEGVQPEKKFVSLKDLLPTDLDPISPEKLDSDEDIDEVPEKREAGGEAKAEAVQKIKEEVVSEAEDGDEGRDDEEDDDDEASPPFEKLDVEAAAAAASAAPRPPLAAPPSADSLDNITSSSSASSETKDLLQFGEVRRMAAVAGNCNLEAASEARKESQEEEEEEDEEEAEKQQPPPPPPPPLPPPGPPGGQQGGERKEARKESRKEGKREGSHGSGSRGASSSRERRPDERRRGEHRHHRRESGHSRPKGGREREQHGAAAKEGKHAPSSSSSTSAKRSGGSGGGGSKREEDAAAKKGHREHHKSSRRPPGERKSGTTSDEHRHERDGRGSKEGQRRAERVHGEAREEGAKHHQPPPPPPPAAPPPTSSCAEGGCGRGGGAEPTKEGEGTAAPEAPSCGGEAPRDARSTAGGAILPPAHAVGELVMKIKKPKIAANIYEVKKIMQVRKNLKKLERERVVSAGGAAGAAGGEEKRKKKKKGGGEEASEVAEASEAKRARLAGTEPRVEAAVETILEKRLLESEDNEWGEVHYLEAASRHGEFVDYVRGLAEDAAEGIYSRVPSPRSSPEVSDFDDAVVLSDVELSREEEELLRRLGARVERGKPPPPSCPAALPDGKRPRRPNPRYNSGEYSTYSDEGEEEECPRAASEGGGAVEADGAALPTAHGGECGPEERWLQQQPPVFSRRTHYVGVEEGRRQGRRLGVRGPVRRPAGASHTTPDAPVMTPSPDADISSSLADAGRRPSVITKGYHQTKQVSRSKKKVSNSVSVEDVVL